MQNAIKRLENHYYHCYILLYDVLSPLVWGAETPLYNDGNSGLWHGGSSGGGRNHAAIFFHIVQDYAVMRDYEG